ncbi:MAG: CpaF family protein, partial [Acidimicrobiia bacterium]|nr:CpaF family protein [Acidimicrobiia bacterium]
MNISELLNGAPPPPKSDDVTLIPSFQSLEDTSPRLVDPLSNLRSRAQAALFERLGSRLFDPNLAEDQLRAYVIRELDE